MQDFAKPGTARKPTTPTGFFNNGNLFLCLRCHHRHKTRKTQQNTPQGKTNCLQPYLATDTFSLPLQHKNPSKITSSKYIKHYQGSPGGLLLDRLDVHAEDTVTVLYGKFSNIPQGS
jgi:hypothetical protein